MRYWLDIHHDGLGLYRRVTGPSREVVEWTARAALEQWEAKWQRQQLAARKRRSRDEARASKEAERAYKEARKQEAADATEAAEQALSALDRLLADTLGVPTEIQFESLFRRDAFSEPAPLEPPYVPQPAQPARIVRAYEPPQGSVFRSFIELVHRPSKERRLASEMDEAAAVHAEGERLNAEAQGLWQAALQQANTENGRRRAAWQENVRQWRGRKEEFESQLAVFNRDLGAMKAGYLAGDAVAVEQYCEMVMSNSGYPDFFPKAFEAQYSPEGRLVAVEYVLPAPDDLPKVKSVKYVVSNDELVEAQISESAAKKAYDSVVYQVILRTIHELFEADWGGVLESVAINAVVETIDRATGKDARPCIASVHVTKAEFQTLNLAAIDPKACFRKLKGVGSSELVALVPVPPIVQMSRDDARFVDGREVLSKVDQGTNLAEMDWQEFEHLVRQLLEREFASAGGEVRVTQASRDGGVDAVVFNPDPLHGGKFVVQAKRYVRAVPVAAVRELWGTMSHEHASKGILVTTATFGPDAYEFAKDKPISLVDGSNLLFLLEKHGTAAFIETKKARMARA
jgi:restriction system protein